MDPAPGLEPYKDHRDRLREFGYNDQEVRFLDLAATHSGYFTRRCYERTELTSRCSRNFCDTRMCRPRFRCTRKRSPSRSGQRMRWSSGSCSRVIRAQWQAN